MQKTCPQCRVPLQERARLLFCWRCKRHFAAEDAGVVEVFIVRFRAEYKANFAHGNVSISCDPTPWPEVNAALQKALGTMNTALEEVRRALKEVRERLEEEGKI